MKAPTLPPAPGVPSIPGVPGGVPAGAKPPPDLRKETMRISLPPRPGPGTVAGAPKPAGAPPLTATQPAKPMNLATGPAQAAGKAPAPATAAGTAPALRAAPAGGVARTVVDTDGGGTALAVAALVASLISFGIVLLSFLGK